MLLFVAAIITLSCLPVSVLSDPGPRDALLYRVDIYVPPEEGRNETADIQQVKETVKSLTDIKVLFSFKELGNPRIILDLTTLEYNEMLEWTFERDVAIRKTVERKKACFKTLADFPVEVMYFGQASQYVMDVMEGYLHGPRYFQNELTRIEQLDDYTGACHKGDKT